MTKEMERVRSFVHRLALGERGPAASFVPAMAPHRLHNRRIPASGLVEDLLFFNRRRSGAMPELYCAA